MKAGIPATDVVDGSYGTQSAAKRYTVGPMVELSLPFSLAVEVDALYRRTGYNTVTGGFGVTSYQNIRANTWEFPLLLKAYLPSPGLPLRPYVAGGYVVRHLSGFKAIVNSTGTDIITGNPVGSSLTITDSRYYVRDNPEHGLALGGGLRLKLGPLALSPEVRWTHWGTVSFDEYGSHGFFVQSKANQVDVLVGFTF